MHDTPEIAWAFIEEQLTRIRDKLDEPLLEGFMFVARRFLTECRRSHLQDRLQLSKALAGYEFHAACSLSRIRSISWAIS